MAVRSIFKNGPESILHGFLIAAEQPDRIAIRHAVAQCLEGLAALPLGRCGNRVVHDAASLASSRTRDDTGLTWSRSRTSSMTRVRRAS